MICSFPTSADDAADLRAKLDSIRRANDVPAVGLVLVEDGKVRVATAWGATGNPQHPSAGADTFFRVGSITKTFTALAMLELVADGKIALDAPLDEVVGEAVMVNPWAASHPVRIVHLLELTAGLSDLSWDGLSHSDPTPLTLTQAIALAKGSLVARWPPGTAHNYTNAAAGLTSLTIERLSGQTFESFVHERVLTPLGMEEASLLRTPVVDARLARGYKPDGETELPYWHMLFRGFGALNATPRQIGLFLERMLERVRSDPRILRAETTLAARVGLTLGYGLGVYAAVRQGRVFYTHGGDADGYRSRIGLLPREGRAYFVVINADQPATLERMRTAVETHLVRDLEPLAPPPAFDAEAAALDRFTGTYYPAVTRFRVDDWAAGRLKTATVTRNGTQLNFSSGGRSTALLPVTPHLFRRLSDPVATIAFIEAEGDLHLQGELGAWRRLPGPAVAAPGGLWP